MAGRVNRELEMEKEAKKIICETCGKELDKNMLLQYQHYVEHKNDLWAKIMDIVHSSPKKFDPKGHKYEG